MSGRGSVMQPKVELNFRHTYLRCFLISAVVPILAIFVILSLYYDREAVSFSREVLAGAMDAGENALETSFAEIEQISFTPYLYKEVSQTMTYMKNGVFRKQGLTIDAYFDRLFLSYEMGLVKPGAEIFRRMIESSGIVPSQTLFIDDSQANVDTGKACGFDTYLAARNEDFRPLFDRIEPSV